MAGAPERLHVAETGSTNSDLLARVHAASATGATSFAPCLLVADRQTAGRGRHGRSWHATPGASLAFSLAWPMARADLAGLSLAIGAALADALEAPGRAQYRIGLKWPNDLWLLDDWSEDARRRGRKLAGVLVETAPFAAGRVAVVGVGINVGAQAGADVASGVASLDEIDPAATVAATLERVAPALVETMRRFDHEGFAPFADRFATRDLLRGLPIAGGGPEGGMEGLAAGIAAHGALLLRTAQGLRAAESGEWRLRFAEPAGSTC